jgi:hypothetical protein
MARTSVVCRVSVYAVTNMSAKMDTYTAYTCTLFPSAIVWVVPCKQHGQAGVSSKINNCRGPPSKLSNMPKHLLPSTTAALQVHVC